MEFGQPYYLLLILLLPILLFWYIKYGQHQEATIRFSNLNLFPKDAIRDGEIKNIVFQAEYGELLSDMNLFYFGREAKAFVLNTFT